MVNSIVKSNLKSNKLKNIMIIITIALTTCLLTSVGVVTENLVKNQKKHTIYMYGNAHGAYRKLSQEQVDRLKRHNDIEIVGENSFQLGKNEFNNSSLSLMYLDENSMKLSNMKIIKGSIPKKHNEIALDETILSILGYKGEVGEKIKFGYNDINYNFTEKEFIVSGILEKNLYGTINNAHSGVVSKELIKEEKYDDRLKASIRLKNEEKLSKDEIESKMTEIAKEFNIDEDNIQFNFSYLSWMKPDPAVVLGGVVVALVVMASSILVIYNIFYISIVNKIQDFGKLKAIGATKKQIKSIIFKEGMILSVISIPLGMIVGYFISKTLMGKFLNSNMEIGIQFEASMSLGIMIGSAILTLLTVYISLLKPMKIASKISPVEAMKYTESNNTKKKTRKGYMDIDVLKLTKANLARNKKRTTITLLSLSLSGIVIMGASTAMGSINTENMVREGTFGDFEFEIKYVGYDYDKEKEEFLKNNPLNEEFINNIKSLDGVKSVNEIREVSVFTPNKGKMKEAEPELKEIEHTVGGYTDQMLKSLEPTIDDGKLNIEKIKNKEEVIINARTAHWLELKAGDNVKIISYKKDKRVEKEVKVQAITNSYNGGDFITSIDFIKNKENNYNTVVSVNVDKNKEKELSVALNLIADNYNNLEFSRFKEEVEENDKLFLVTGSMGYVLVGIIGVISLVNLINTMITSMMSRKREIGVLQAIGMTDSQLLKMFKYEGLFYTVITVVSSLGIGSFIGYLIYKAMYLSGATYTVYKFPTISAIILVVVMVIVQLGMGRVINKVFKKESLIDRVRYSE